MGQKGGKGQGIQGRNACSNNARILSMNMESFDEGLGLGLGGCSRGASGILAVVFWGAVLGGSGAVGGALI